MDGRTRASNSRRRPVAWPLLVSGTFAVAGCSFIYSSDLSDAHSFPEVDANGDAGVSSDGPTRDAPEANAEAGGETKRGCASYVPAPKHCRDFDDDAPLQSDGWRLDIDPPGSTQLVELDTTAYSSPRALHTALRGAPGCSYARLIRDFENTGTQQLDVRLRLRPSAPWNDTDGALIVHVNDDSAERCSFILYLQDAEHDDDDLLDSAQVNMQQDGNDVRPLEGFAPADEWTDFGMVVTPASGGGVSVVFSFRREDGTLSEKTHTYPTCKIGGKVTVKAGFHCESPTGDMRYDDIRVDWR